MWVTGLKVRYFLITFFVLLCTVGAVGYLQVLFSKSERLRQVDQQIERSASLLLSSNLSNSQLEDMDEADEVVFDVLDGPRVNQIILIYNQSGKLLYRNKTARELDLVLPVTHSLWESSVVEDHTIRHITLDFPQKKRVLQVGLVLNDELLHWRLMSQRFFAYVGLILLVVLAISVFLASILLRPVRRLSDYLQHFLTHLNKKGGEATPVLDYSLEKIAYGPFSRFDEFSKLLRIIQGLVNRVQVNFTENNARSALLAHELKTPLTIMRSRLEVLSTDNDVGDLPKMGIKDILRETDQLGAIIQSFLEWSYFENKPGLPEEIHAIKMDGKLTELGERLLQVYPGRIKWEIEAGTVIFAKQLHFEEVVTNLILNALKYSPPDSPVSLIQKGTRIFIRDQGSGVSPDVLRRLGAPFNSGIQRQGVKGTGLGLAWVYAICQKYRWKLYFRNAEPLGTEVEVDFFSETEDKP